jgi:CheY-like chemotaxis protein
MVVEEGQKLPFDISQYGAIAYEDTVSDASDFEEKLLKFVQRIDVDQPVDSPAIEFLGPQVSYDYQQRMKDLETNYRNKLDKIVKLLQDIQRDTSVIKEPRAKKPKPVERKVLWVDDYPSNNEAIIDLYRQQGVEFDLALNTAQALDFLAKKEYDIVLSDIGRGSEPDAGVRMIREINRHFGSHPPILIFASIRSVEQFGESARTEGASFVTSSPSYVMLQLTKILNLW